MNEIQKTQLQIDALQTKVAALKAIDKIKKEDIAVIVAEKEALLVSKKQEFAIKHNELKNLRDEINGMIEGLTYLKTKKQ